MYENKMSRDLSESAGQKSAVSVLQNVTEMWCEMTAEFGKSLEFY